MATPDQDDTHCQPRGDARALVEPLAPFVFRQKGRRGLASGRPVAHRECGREEDQSDDGAQQQGVVDQSSHHDSGRGTRARSPEWSESGRAPLDNANK